MNSRGFTAVEILVVIIIMAILLTLAVVNVRSTQVKARDNDRTVDVENIMTTMDTFYNASHGDFTRTYPGTMELYDSGYVMNFIKERISIESLRAPGVTEDDPISLVMATNNNQTAAGVQPRPTITTYVYQPIRSDGQLCSIVAGTGGCRKFNIYYRLEEATPDCPAPDNICVAKSRYQ